MTNKIVVDPDGTSDVSIHVVFAVKNVGASTEEIVVTAGVSYDVKTIGLTVGMGSCVAPSCS